MRIRIRPVLALVAALAATAACSKKENTQTVDTASGNVVSPVSVTSVDVGRTIAADKSIADKTDTFAKTDTIYAAVVTTGSGTGTLRARWTFQDGQVIDESTQDISPTGPAHTEFHVTKPSGWPVGKYRVEIQLNGAVVGSKEFEVK